MEINVKGVAERAFHLPKAINRQLAALASIMKVKTHVDSLLLVQSEFTPQLNVNPFLAILANLVSLDKIPQHFLIKRTNFCG